MFNVEQYQLSIKQIGIQLVCVTVYMTETSQINVDIRNK